MSCPNAARRNLFVRGTDAALFTRHVWDDPIGSRLRPQRTTTRRLRWRTRWSRTRRARGGPFRSTGYWVAQITEDWKERIHPAAKGDVGSIPVSAAGRREAAAWDPALANSCKAYGVGGILRMPGRLHIAWEGNNLKIESDAGAQTRVLSFGPRAAKLGACRVSPSHPGIVLRLLSAASRWEDAAVAEAP